MMRDGLRLAVTGLEMINSRIGLLAWGPRQGLLAAAVEAGEHTLAGGADRGEDVAGLADRSDVLIDFSAPQALEGNLHAAVGAGVPLLIGTTGLDDSHHRAIDEAARVVSHLQSNLGIEVWMLTGDNERTAQAIARQCGISRVLAKVRPDDKARNVTSLMDQGHVVAMVGDGINDSPALAAADLGVAIGAGAQIAVETADVVLIRSVLDDVATAMTTKRSSVASPGLIAEPARRTGI